jgi:hypothetical protein
MAIQDQRPQPPPPPPGQPPTVLPPAPTNVVGGFPPRGLVRICSIGNVTAVPPQINVELVYYRRITRTGTQTYLDQCERGLFGTTPAPHFWGGTVTLESIELTQDPTTGYPPRATFQDPRSYVSLSLPDPDPQAQAGDTLTEWLSILHIDPAERRARMDGRHFLLMPAVETYAPFNLQPGAGGALSGFVPNDLLAHPRIAGVSIPGNIRARLGADYLYRLLQAKQVSSLPGDPGSWLLDDPALFGTDPNFMHPLKEILKRQQRSGSRATKGSRRPMTPRPAPPAAPPQTDAHLGHPATTQVMPTFVLRRQEGTDRIQIGQNQQGPVFFDPAQPEPGEGDVVTVTDESGGAPLREEQRVAHTARAVGGDRGDPGWLVAFDDFVQREYQGAAQARLAKWPTGNVGLAPDLVFGRARSPSGPNDVVADAPGTLQGSIDDVVTLQLEEGNDDLLLAGPVVPGDAQVTPVRGGPQGFRRGRLYLTDSGEVIATTGADDTTGPNGQNNGWVTVDALRGALGTTAGPIGPETVPWRLPWPPVAIGNGAIGGGRRRTVPIRNPGSQVNGTRWREGADGGYVALDRGGGQGFEGVLPYDSVQNRSGNWFLQRPVDRFERGTFNGAFGSARIQPDRGSLLVDLPFRSHDRYRDRVSSLEGVFFQFARELPGSLILDVTWDEQTQTGYDEVKVAVRLDGGPSWDALPANGPGLPGRLYLFDDPRQPNQILLPADRVEVRLYITFKQGAFTNDAWKQAALVGGLRVRYRQATRVLRREERVE